MRMSPDTEESVRCSVSGCSCVCFKPGNSQLRSCDRCGHSWVPHALAKLQFQAQLPTSCGPVEVALPGLVFDLSSLVLYGAQAVPVRLKILLDRLYSILTPEQVGHILHTLGWSLGDYVRGYMLQHPGGKVLDRWSMVTPEEELLVLKQFLRFGETRPIVELMTLQCLEAVNRLSDPALNPDPKSVQSNIKTLAEQKGGTPAALKNTRGDSPLVAGICRFKKNSPVDHNNTVHHFENLPGGPSLLLPFHFPNSPLHCLVPPTKELVPPSKLTQCLRKLTEAKLPERHRQEGGRREQQNDPILQQSKVESGLKIKADPDKPNPARSIWHQEPRFHDDQELDLHRGMAKQEITSALSPSLSSSFIPTSSSLHLTISACPLKISQKVKSSSSYSLNHLPSFSSSFLCPLPTSSFSSSIHPLPSPSSSLCPLPSSLCSITSLSPAGGRKGRVCCGVCGKSFYDKGTLKIHYNAVHLKIKHRCTVAGCTMVFSSLRSRNRHSANPNPRLHTGTATDAHSHRITHADLHTSIHSDPQLLKDRDVCKDTRTSKDKDIGDTIWQQGEDTRTLRNRLNGHTNLQHGDREGTPPPSPHPLHRNPSQHTNQNFILCDRSPPPPPPPPLLPACSASSLGSPPSLIPLVIPTVDKTERCQRPVSVHSDHAAPAPLPRPASITTASLDDQPASHDYDVTEGTQDEARGGPLTDWRRRESADPVPKKKPRKSSMPVKIEREKVEGGRGEEEE